MELFVQLFASYGGWCVSFSAAPTARPYADGAFAASLPLLRKRRTSHFRSARAVERFRYIDAMVLFVYRCD
ncbi:MAG: hypothetical protein KUF82_19020 [Candidatus Thiodiazotropha sp. (ex Ctena orbiculata)]|nr:hypothetical protein [Candidatus Thiodiazotropha taylori]